MHIAVVEDNEEHRTTLVNHLNSFAKEFGIAITVDSYESGFSFLDHFHSNYDIIYLDVQMPHMDGMETAHEIRSRDTLVDIVFVTNYVQWAIYGYAVNASDFLLKPLTYFNFQEHFKKINNKIAQRGSNFISIKTPSGIRKLNVNEILYIESEGHYLSFHLLEETFSILETMREMEETLVPYNFFRCNNSYIVNLKYVQGVEKNIVSVGSSELQISRPRRKEFLEALTNYISENRN